MAEEKMAQFVKAISVTSLAILLGMEGYQARAAIPFCQQRLRAPKSSANMQRALFNPMQYEDNNWMAVKIKLKSSFYVVT